MNFGRWAGSAAERLRRAGFQPAFLSLLTCLLACRYLWAHANKPIRAHNLVARAWFGWADQSEYLRAAMAWASWTLTPSEHHYPAGYALLAAPFVALFPDEPFILVDLLCWVASLWVFAALAVQLLPGLYLARTVGGFVFFLATVANTSLFYTWLTPWTSTPATLCIYLALLAAVHYANAASLRLAFAASLAAGLTILFRPTDSVVVGLPVALFLAVCTVRQPRGMSLFRLAVCAGAGFVIGPILLVATHVATHGLTLGSYIEEAGQIGFEWRLLPLRWVTLMLNPKPLYPEGTGLAQAYWWILPGMAGIITGILADRGRRLHHLFVGGTAILFTCMYLCYRDLHVPGLFGFNNQHYFKWVIPVFALYCAGLARFLFVERKLAAVAAATAVIISLSCWRAELVAIAAPPGAAVLPDGHGLVLPGGPAPLDIAYLAASPDDFIGLYLGHHTIDQGSTIWHANSDFKIFPIPLGFMLLPLRVLPQQPSILHLQSAVTLNTYEKVFSARQRVVFGLPCMILHKRSSCQYTNGLGWNALHIAPVHAE